MLYRISQGQLSSMRQKKVLEKQVEELVGENLESLLGLDKVCYQFTVEGKRIDILAFDREVNAPVIIELKKENSSGLFDQGMEYFHLLSNRKAEFLLKINEVLKIPAQLSAVDWSASKVIFIGRNFDQRQRRAVDFKGLPIELYDYDWYEDGFFKLEPVGLEKRAQLEIQGLGDKKGIETVKKEFREYFVEDHFKPDWEESRSLFEILRKRILDLDPRIEEHAQKYYIGYKISGLKWNITGINIQKSKLKVSFVRVEKNDLKDPEDRIISIPWEDRGWGKMCVFDVREDADIDYAMFLLRQVYEKFYKQ